MSIKGFKVGSGTVNKYDYNSLDNLPNTDITLSISGRAADAKAVGDKVGLLTGQIDYAVPDYFSSHLETVKQSIVDNLNSTKTAGTSGIQTESFIFITDPHWRSNKCHSPALIKDIIKSVPVNTIICGGDIVQAHTTTKQAVSEEINGFVSAMLGTGAREFYAVFGNHDDNSHQNGDNIAAQLTKDEQYQLMFNSFAGQGNVHFAYDMTKNDGIMKNDYFFDHPRTRTRYLCIDWNDTYSTDRTSWVTSVLSQNDDYRVVIVHHGIYRWNSSTEDIELEHNAIMEKIAPYKSKIVCIISGHAHTDYVEDYFCDGSVPIIGTAADKWSSDYTAETIAEQCFDVVTIDYTNSKISLVRVGRGSDREVEISLS